MVNPTNAIAAEQRFLYTKSELAFALFDSHRTSTLYQYLDDEVLQQCGWTLHRFKTHRKKGLPIPVVEVILNEVGLTWSELNARLR